MENHEYARGQWGVGVKNLKRRPGRKSIPLMASSQRNIMKGPERGQGKRGAERNEKRGDNW